MAHDNHSDDKLKNTIANTVGAKLADGAEQIAQDLTHAITDNADAAAALLAAVDAIAPRKSGSNEDNDAQDGASQADSSYDASKNSSSDGSSDNGSEHKFDPIEGDKALEALSALAALAQGRTEVNFKEALAEPDADKLKEGLTHLEVYEKPQLKQVREHIEKFFGPIYLQVEDVNPQSLRCDIAIIKPDTLDDPAHIKEKDEQAKVKADGKTSQEEQTKAQDNAQEPVSNANASEEDSSLTSATVKATAPEQDENASSCKLVRDHYLLVTKGMGAHKMPIPEEFKEYQLERAELFVALPENWALDSEDDADSWPITLLSVMSRLPIVYDSWLAQGHIVRFEDVDMAPGTNFKGAILLSAEPWEAHNEVGAEGNDDSTALCLKLKPSDSKEEGKDCEVVNFYQVIPLYEEELDYANKYSARTLMRLMSKDAYIADPKRPLTHLRTPKKKH